MPGGVALPCCSCSAKAALVTLMSRARRSSTPPGLPAASVSRIAPEGVTTWIRSPASIRKLSVGDALP